MQPRPGTKTTDPATGDADEGGPAPPDPDTPAARRWPQWAMLGAFAFIGFECVLLAIVMRGPWLILLAPGIVCAYRAWEQWRELQGRGRR